jgi:predicted nucleic acid-binding protein
VSYLLDTNVLSELRRRQPDANVVAWFAKRPPSTLYLSVLTLGELRKGVDAMADAARRLTLLDWLETELPAYFTGRVLDVNAAVADRWGRMTAQAGRPLPAIDSLLAATAVQHGLILVTRNLRDVQGLAGLTALNPWDALA